MYGFKDMKLRNWSCRVTVEFRHPKECAGKSEIRARSVFFKEKRVARGEWKAARSEDSRGNSTKIRAPWSGVRAANGNPTRVQRNKGSTFSSRIDNTLSNRVSVPRHFLFLPRPACTRSSLFMRHSLYRNIMSFVGRSPPALPLSFHSQFFSFFFLRIIRSFLTDLILLDFADILPRTMFFYDKTPRSTSFKRTTNR